MNRRQFLQATSAVLAHQGLAHAAIHAVDVNETSLARDPRRPQFHLLPAKNWMNDPNGPIYFNGRYHMFFQYNPQAAVWGNMSWNHAASPDMIHWEHLPVALVPTSDGPDSAGCFSGSTITVPHGGGQRVYALYTGVVHDKQNETIRNEGLRESQCLAWSDDPMLRTWQKQAEPILPRPPQGLHITGFRDPCLLEQDGSYLMIVGSGINSVGGCALLYRSPDLKQWDYLHPIATGSWNGAVSSNPVDDGEMWECPDLFALDGKFVLIYSTLRRVFWQSGTLDPATLRFTPEKGGLLDLGDFYAPKTQLDANGRRILWGWIPEKRSEAAMREAGWSGMMSLPRVLRLSPDGTLRIQLLPELKTLRSDAGLPMTRSRAEVTLTLPVANGEITCKGKRGQPLHVSIQLAGNEILSIEYLPGLHAVRMADREVALDETHFPSLHLLVDGSIVEAIVSETMACTKRFYYDGDLAPDVTIHITGGVDSVECWKVRPISNDRLTT
ncbi:glycoside hydrolase family 32 protein [Terriglobus sp. TAA 43]|uniref:glycoside hydrolase family 32 protein n=1 Tax=Terriglobus sp. TAA 43 TaxID=278961 RepID=UPI00068C4918|nr:glycoside hydrolase family 32 protein [Terriglobus sp. TAA 43]